MVVANQDARTKLHDDSEQTGGWVGAARVIADVFLERFFVTVRAYDARLDGYLWHGRQSYFMAAGQLMTIGALALIDGEGRGSLLLQVAVLRLLNGNADSADRPANELSGGLVALGDSVAAVVADAEAVA